MSAVIQLIVDRFYYIFLGLLGAYVIVKIRNRHSDRKRRIFFILAIGVFLIYTGAIMIMQEILPSWTLGIVVLGVIAGEVYFLRKNWHFKMDCVKCGKRMDWGSIITDDRNLCHDCLSAAEESGAAETVQESPDTPDEEAEGEGLGSESLPGE